MEKQHEMTIGNPGKKSLDAQVYEKHFDYTNSDVKRALEIILGLEENMNTAKTIDTTKARSISSFNNEHLIIKKAFEFRNQFEIINSNEN